MGKNVTLRRRAVCALALTVVLLVGGAPALARETSEASAAGDAETARAWRELAQGGVVVLLRHARTEPGVGDPPGFRLQECRTQRNLSAEGREDAARIGAAFAARGQRVDRIYSSPWCRCLDTARLAFPGQPVQVLPVLASLFEDRRPQAQYNAALRERIQQAAARGETVVMVTHMVNISALVGTGVAMGEAVLVRADSAAEGGLRVVGRLRF